MSHSLKALPLSAAALLLGAGALWAGLQSLAPEPAALTAWVPQGSLLAIEAKDFSALLKDWSASAEKRAWLSSESFSGFSRSRLFARLGEAQQQFAVSAGLPPDMSFLTQVAGKESLFAWYDIGNLEFLYITRLPSGVAEQSQLLQQRSKFETRKAGAETFYERSQGDPKRIVAFAMHGDYLLLATREDLIANALLLMQGQGSLDLREEHWFASAVSAANGPTGDLRMTLNLTAIVPSPYFRSYWVQQNISEMKQYSAAASDLYRTPDAFREERVLIPKDPETVTQPADLAPVLKFLPITEGVYRAVAHPTTDHVMSALSERLLFRDIAGYRDERSAPAADLSQQTAGSASDLETFLDVSPLPQQPVATALEPLRSLVSGAHVDAMLLTSSTEDPPDHLFLPIHSTIALSGASTWNAVALEAALSAALQARLTAGDNGLRWKPRQQGGFEWVELEGLQPLAFAVNGNVCILASDSTTLLGSLEAQHPARPQIATAVAGFDHASERPRFLQLTGLLDHRTIPRQAGDQSDSQGESASSQASQGVDEEGAQPNFFSGNIRGLSDTFQALASETFLEQSDPKSHAMRQTVIYRWRH